MSYIYDLSKELDKIVVLVIFSSPLYTKNTHILLIKRPPDDEWAPNKYSPPCGHIKLEDVKHLKTFPPETQTREHLYIRAGLRELKEEVMRDPSFTQLEYVGGYHDDDTGYDNIVLMGYMAPSSLKNINELEKRKTKIKPTPEATEVIWKSIKGIEKLKEKNEIVGERAIEMTLNLYCV